MKSCLRRSSPVFFRHLDCSTNAIVGYDIVTHARFIVEQLQDMILALSDDGW